ncbi:MAG: DNA polymerase III subunit [Waddliaceae bacterium]
MIDGFAELKGNDRVKKHLRCMLEKKKIPHSLLFAGPKGCGKDAFAKAFAQRILETHAGEHPDLYHYRPEGKIGMHSISSMRELTEEVFLLPFKAKKKVFIVSHAERMLPTGANALLKTFEEPAPHSIIILISGAPKQLLPTILSRCQTIRFQSAEGASAEEKSALHRSLLSALAEGRHESYHHLLFLVKELTQTIQDTLKQQEEQVRAHLIGGLAGQSSAIQREAVEKEVEGHLSLQKIREASTVFHAILSWYRDLQLLRVKGKKTYLMNPDYHEELMQALQQGKLRPLENVLDAIADAQLSLERATPLENCLEHLFLSISQSTKKLGKNAHFL